MAQINEERLYSSFGEESVLRFYGPARILSSSSFLSNQPIVAPNIVVSPLEATSPIEVSPKESTDKSGDVFLDDTLTKVVAFTHPF